MGYNGFTAVMCLLVLMPGSASSARIFRELTVAVSDNFAYDRQIVSDLYIYFITYLRITCL